MRKSLFPSLLTALLLAALLVTTATEAGTNKNAPPSQSTDPAVIGKWELQQGGTTTIDNSWSNEPLPIHLSLLPNGKLLFWGRDKRQLFNPSSGQFEWFDDYGYTTARVWDPFYKTFTNVDLGSINDHSKTNLFCSGHSFLPDGRLLVTGGHRVAEEFGHPEFPFAESLGSANTNIFDYKTNQWSLGPVMNNGRWYPFNVTLGNGETLIVSGTYFDTITSGVLRTAYNKIPQIYSLSGTMRDVKDVQVALPGASVIDNYPRLHLLSDGRVSVSVAGGNNVQNYVLTPSATNGEGLWQSAPSQNFTHTTGTSVMYDKDKILFPGGGFNTTPQNETETLTRQSNGNLLWTAEPAANWMTYKRMHQTGTVLPDGKVLITGGTPCTGSNNVACDPGAALTTPELWDPTTRMWTSMVQHQETRVYHSTAILLPDGRVLVGGGGRPAAQGEVPPGQPPCLTSTVSTPNASECRKFGHNNVEIFMPPYFFVAGSNGTLAPRPAITSAPKEITYGQQFTVGVGAAAVPGGNVNANDVEAAALIRLGSVTHGINQDQRRLTLTIGSRAENGRSLMLTAPANGNECPPGYYMLFLLKRNGNNLTPSIAKIVRVNNVSTGMTFQAIEGRGETRSMFVTLAPGTTWNPSVTSGGSFISNVSVTPSGAPNLYTLSFTVAPNNGTERRSGAITLSVTGQPSLNQVVTIYQGKQFGDVTTPPSEPDVASKFDAMKITSGCSATGFCPNDSITREQLAVFIVRAAINAEVNPPTDNTLNVEPPLPTQVSFSDVPATHQFYRYIEDLKKRGFSGGCGAAPPGGLPPFCPGDFVTRAQLATFVMKLLGIAAPSPATNPIYTDMQDYAWATNAAEEATLLKIMLPCQAVPTGNGGTVYSFCPGAPVTRREVAEVISRIYGY
jgi:hypothetical protein